MWLLRRVLVWVVLAGGVSAVLLVLGVGAFIQTGKVKQGVERFASAQLGRAVMMDGMQVGLGRNITIEVRDFKLANVPWGSEPYMTRFDRLSAVVDAGELWRGRAVFHALSIDGLNIFLERDQNGKGNWKFKNSKPYVPRDPFTYEAKDRSDFPIILNGTLQNGLFRMKTTGGSLIRIDGKNLKMTAENDKSPVVLDIDGAYGGMPAQLTVAGDSYSVLRDPSTPYPAKVKIVVGRGALHFTGTLTDPLDADGIKGVATIDASVLDDIYNMVGLSLKGRFPLQIIGDLTRAEDVWVYENQRGHAAGSAFTGSLKLVEGARKEPDFIAIDAAFKAIDTRLFIDGTTSLSRKTKLSDIDTLSLRADPNPDVILDAKISAGEVRYDKFIITDVTVHAKNKPGYISLDPFSFNMAGGRADVKMNLDAKDKTPRLHTRIDYKNADIARILHFTDFADGLITGRLTAQAELSMNGETFHKALRNSTGGIVTFLKQGRISRDLVDKASMDVLALFRDEDGWAPINCMLGIYSMRNGLGAVMPLRFVTPELTFYGTGPVNLLNRQIDVVLQGDSDHTLALDIPLRLSGDMASINITPLIFGTGPDVDLNAEKKAMSSLPPFLRAVAEKNYCTH